MIIEIPAERATPYETCSVLCRQDADCVKGCMVESYPKGPVAAPKDEGPPDSGLATEEEDDLDLTGVWP